MHLEKGKVYIVNDTNSKKLDHLKYDLENHFEKFIFLNFANKNSLKVAFWYEKLKKRLVKEVKKEISHIIGESFELEDAEYSEKVIITSYLLLKENEVIVVNTIGMSFHSIDYFKEKFMKITDVLDRTLVIYNNRTTEMEI